MRDTTLALDGGTPVRSSLLDHRRGAALIGEQEQEAVAAVLTSQSLFRYYGPDLQGTVEAFERGVEQQLGVPHALATSSGTAALTAALAALGVGPGDEVVVPAVTFVATANAVVVAGAVPVFCDLDDSLGLDPAALSAVLSPRTAAVVPVHLENVVCDMDGVLAVTRPVGVPVLEDACQAMGSSYRGRAAGTLGELGAFSLQLEKNITAGEGGVVVTSDPELALRAARYTDQGGQFVTARGARGEGAPFIGENLRMNELSGAVAGVQLGRLPGLVARMRAAKAAVLELVGTHPDRVLRSCPDPQGDGGSSIIWYLPTPEHALRFVAALLAEGIPSATVYGGQPVYTNPAYAQQLTVTPSRSPWARHPVPVPYRPGMCPRAEDLAARAAAVAIGPGYTDSDVQDVAAAVDKVTSVLLA
ncbi:MAG TPA: aminotransferase class I/II-fold pyridoxal phosphate-dependent enzyme [Mycobacteriales bacterium]|nr:aminotransferase class I/II-fold pyridoxal phosphate-dependent enzyme [Mycobacteriales bacterium]